MGKPGEHTHTPVGDLPQCSFTHNRGAILDAQEQLHDCAILKFGGIHLVLIHILHQDAKVLLVFWFKRGQGWILGCGAYAKLALKEWILKLNLNDLYMYNKQNNEWHLNHY